MSIESMIIIGLVAILWLVCMYALHLDTKVEQLEGYIDRLHAFQRICDEHYDE